MSSPSEINRANSQHSTGPRTEQGKKKSSLNALRHGLSGQIVVMPSEDLSAYQAHIKSFTGQYHPKTAMEANLVQILADTTWRLHRVAALETNLFALSVSPQSTMQNALDIAASLQTQAKALSNLSLHGQRLSRQLEKTEKQLRELQQLRCEQEAQAMNQALDLIELAENKAEPYDPTADGFVFSNSEIDQARRLRTRDRRAQNAHRLNAAA